MDPEERADLEQRLAEVQPDVGKGLNGDLPTSFLFKALTASVFLFLHAHRFRVSAVLGRGNTTLRARFALVVAAIPFQNGREGRCCEGGTARGGSDALFG